MSKFINPFSDYGFKLIFGSEVSKDLIISFLNGVLHDEVIINITFRNVEMLGMKQDQRRAVFDIFCENEKGEFLGNTNFGISKYTSFSVSLKGIFSSRSILTTSQRYLSGYPGAIT